MKIIMTMIIIISGRKLQLKGIKTETTESDPRLGKSLHLPFARFSRHMMLGSINHQTAKENKLNITEGTAQVAHHDSAAGVFIVK